MRIEPDLRSVGSTYQGPASEVSSPEVSVVMPCLNEAETLGTCIEKATRALRQLNIAGEIIVADNGDRKSTRLNSSHIQKSRMPSSA